jgi:hypothetical protein
VAILAPSSWAESETQYERLYSHRPAVIAQFVERVPMIKGRWDTEADTATTHAWFAWPLKAERKDTSFAWIPPGYRKKVTKPDDAIRFGGASGRALSSRP